MLLADVVSEIKYGIEPVANFSDSTLSDFLSWSIFADDTPKQSPVVRVPSSHEQDDGTILATCITGTGSKDSVATWVKLLEETNPRLAHIPVVFLLRTEEAAIQTWTDPAEKDTQMSSDIK